MTEPIEPNQPNPELSRAIRAMGERDRTPEGKQARNAFAGRTEDFLKTIEAAKLRGDTVRVGEYVFPIDDDPRITETRLGKTALGFISVAESWQPGVHFSGDGIFEPRKLQAVLPINGSISLIEVTGADPMLPPLGDQDFKLENSQMDYARIRMRGTQTSEDEVTDVDTTFSVRGDGNVYGPVQEWQGQPITGFSERGIANSIAGQGYVDGIADTLQILPGQQ